MLQLILGLPWYFIAIIFVTFVVSIAICGLLIIRKNIPINILKANHEVAGIAFGIIGIVYGVVLGYIIPSVQERYNTVHVIAEKEATILSDLFRDSYIFPKDTGDEIRSALRKYAQSVIDNEWDTLAYGITSHDTTVNSERIWNAYYNFTPSSEKESIWYRQSISKLNTFNGTRLARIDSSHETLGILMWTLLILGAVVITVFLYFFALEHLISQMLITGLLTGTLAFMLFLLFLLDRPFIGNIKVQPKAMEIMLERFDLWESEQELRQDRVIKSGFDK